MTAIAAHNVMSDLTYYWSHVEDWTGGWSAATYARISTERNAVGVTDQKAGNARLVERREYALAGDFCDDGIPATRDKVTALLYPRPGWDALLRMIETFAGALVIVWPRHDRACRDLESLANFFQACRVAQINGLPPRAVEVHDGGGRMAPLEPYPMQMLIQAVGQAMGEVAIKDKRSKGSMVEAAARGSHHGGAISWGYRYEHNERVIDPVTKQPKMTGEKLTGKTLRLVPAREVWKRWGRLIVFEPEAKIIIEVAARLLSGEKTSRVVRDLNERGVLTVHSKRWTTTTLSDAIRAPRLAGLRTHHTGTHSTRRLPGVTQYTAKAWDGILSVEQHEALVALYRLRALGPRDATRVPTLLSGFLRCGKCGARMTANVIKTVPWFCCPTVSNLGCGGVAIRRDKAEAEALDRLLEEIDRPSFSQALRRALSTASDDSTLIGELSQARAEKTLILADLDEQVLEGKLRADRFASLSSRLESDIADIDARMAQIALRSRPVASLSSASRRTSEPTGTS